MKANGLGYDSVLSAASQALGFQTLFGKINGGLPAGRQARRSCYF